MDDETISNKLSEQDLIAMINVRISPARDHIKEWREDEMNESFNFVAGWQWTDEDINKLKAEDRPTITFNRINSNVRAVLGIETNQRQEIKYLPRENQDQGLSETLSEIDRWLADNADIETEDSMAFEDMITCGMGWTETRMSYDEDLDGKFIREEFDPGEALWDIAAKKRNLSDARWVAREREMDYDEIMERWPDADIADFDRKDYLGDTTTVTVKPGDQYDSDSPARLYKRKPYTVLQFQWYELIPWYRAQDTATGKIIELSEEEYKQNKDILTAGGAKIAKQRKRHYYQAFLTGHTLIQKEDLPSQKMFTLQCITGQRDRKKGAWFGLVRLMRDPQRWANKFFSQFQDIINSNAKGGIIVEEDTFVDVKKAEASWAKTESIIYAKKGAITRGQIMPRPTAPYPQGVDRMLQFAIAATREAPGINLELIGMADREQAGILEETRKRSAYAILSPYFDSLSTYRRRTGRLTLEFIKEYIPLQRIIRMLNPQYIQYASLIKEMDLNLVDIVVTEAPQSENNKLLTWAFITQVLPVLADMGLPIPPEIIEYSPLPAPLSKKWSKMAEEAGRDPVRQIAQELEMQDKMAEIQKKTQEAYLAQAKAIYERIRPQIERAKIFTQATKPKGGIYDRRT